MKKLSIIALAVAAVALWACSKSGPAADPANAWMFDETLPVPIQLGGGEGFSVYTKAIEGKIETLVDKEIRVSAIDLHLGVDPDAQGWSDELGYCTGVTTAPLAADDIYFDAVRAKVNAEGYVKFLSGTTGNTEMKRYYPFSETKKVKNGDDVKYMHMGSNYSFIAYYTPAITQAPVLENGRMLKKFRMLTNNDSYNLDVLWARVDAKPGLIHDDTQLAADDAANDGFLRGFNARYQRYFAKQNGGVLSPDDTPELKFQHAASMIHIFVKAENTEAEASFSGNLTVTNMKLNTKINYVALDLLSGELIADPSPAGTQAIVLDYNPKSTAIHPVAGEGEEYNEGFFVVPGERSEEQRISVTFDINVVGGSNATKTVDLPLPTYLDETTQTDVIGYKAGVEYNYYISVESIEEIYLKTSLTGWDSTSGAGQLGDQTIVLE